MNEGKLRRVGQVLALALALAMLIPMGMMLQAQGETTDLYVVTADSSKLAQIRGSSLSMERDYGGFVMLKLGQGVKNECFV